MKKIKIKSNHCLTFQQTHFFNTFDSIHSSTRLNQNRRLHIDELISFTSTKIDSLSTLYFFKDLADSLLESWLSF